jgi:hypothetical protein
MKGELMADNNQLQEIKDKPDTNILEIIKGKIQETESLGFPTDTVFVPDAKSYVEIYRIKKIKSQPGFDKAAVAYATTKKDIPGVKEIKKLQKKIKADGYEFLIRGFNSEAYTELNKSIVGKESEEGAEPAAVDNSGLELLAMSILGYTKNGKFTDWEHTPKDDKISFLSKLDATQQLPLLINAINNIIQTSQDFEKAMQDVIF